MRIQMPNGMISEDIWVDFNDRLGGAVFTSVIRVETRRGKPPRVKLNVWHFGDVQVIKPQTQEEAK